MYLHFTLKKLSHTDWRALVRIANMWQSIWKAGPFDSWDSAFAHCYLLLLEGTDGSILHAQSIPWFGSLGFSLPPSWPESPELPLFDPWLAGPRFMLLSLDLPVGLYPLTSPQHFLSPCSVLLSSRSFLSLKLQERFGFSDFHP